MDKLTPDQTEMAIGFIIVFVIIVVIMSFKERIPIRKCSITNKTRFTRCRKVGYDCEGCKYFK